MTVQDMYLRSVPPNLLSAPQCGASLNNQDDGLKEDVEDTEGDPTGDRLRVVVLSGPDQVLRYALRFLPGRRHSFLWS